ncbi:MAG TPA: hypothetical protein PLD47_12020 [Aggregatilineales bacterium]|nr:hypothetical protein [Anaerolineales bacterium]HRE48442.1 hypothetical protein [Aggregatilineales bacterium]
MTLQEVLQEAKNLSIKDRQELIKLLVDTLIMENITPPSLETFLNPDVAHEVWSPYDSFKAAQQLQDMLDAYRREPAQS